MLTNVTLPLQGRDMDVVCVLEHPDHVGPVIWARGSMRLARLQAKVQRRVTAPPPGYVRNEIRLPVHGVTETCECVLHHPVDVVPELCDDGGVVVRALREGESRHGGVESPRNAFDIPAFDAAHRMALALGGAPAREQPGTETFRAPAGFVIDALELDRLGWLQRVILRPA